MNRHFYLYLFLLWSTKISECKPDDDCPENFFNCGNGRCIGHFWRCDGEDDCGNWADEHSCNSLEMEAPKPKPCPKEHSHCNDTKGTCIPNKWLCDGMSDCDNGFDEKNCTKELAKCSGFLCNNFECVPSRWRCDGIADCTDASDELDCPQPKTKQVCDKDQGFFQCMTGECVPYTKVCDHHKDCPNGDDEGSECKPDGCHKKCSQMCFVGPHGPQCYCRKGYHLAADNMTCLDIDECDDNRRTGLCSHMCINTNGGYRCECHEDYQLVRNTTCIIKNEEPLLIFSNSEGIRGLGLQTGRFFPVYHNLGQTVGLDFLNSEERVFWVNSNKDDSGVFSVTLNQQDFKPIVTNGLKSPEDIAIDWVGSNFYVTDAELNAIVVCRIDGALCVSTLFGHLHRPRAIVVDPPKGLLYWTEWGNASGIYRAGMDGSDKTHLINDGIWPNGLALDAVSNRLYWTEAKTGKIEFLDLYTNQRRDVVSDRVFHPFALAVFEDWIYWSDWFSYSLDVSHKITGHNQSTLLREVNEHIKGIHVFHPLLQKSTYNPCWFHSCSHLCVLAPNRSYSCVCPEHLELHKDNKTCVPKSNDSFLMISVGEQIMRLYPESIGNDVTIDVELPRRLAIEDVALNWNDKRLYIFDSKKAAIGSYELEIRETKDNFWKPLITDGLDMVEGLTYDPNTNQLYWLQPKEGVLEVSTTDGKSRAVVVRDLDKPIDLALHPSSGRMYVAVMGKDPHIMVCDMDGQNSKVLLASKTGFAVSLVVANDVLYWADAKNGLIEYLKTKVPKRHPHRKGVVKQNLGHVMSIAVHNNSLFWTDLDSDAVYHQSLSAPKSQRHSKIILNVAHKGKAVKKLSMALPEPVVNTKCVKDKGGCSHICLLGRFGPTCKCPHGYQLHSNGQTCEKHIDMSDNSVHCTDCVTSGHSFNDAVGLIPLENSDEDDLNWLTDDDDREADVLFARYDKQQKVNESDVHRHDANDQSRNDSSTEQSIATTMTATDMTTKMTPKRTKGTKGAKIQSDMNRTKKPRGRTSMAKSEESRNKKSDNYSEANFNTEPMKSEEHDSHSKGWLTLFVALLVVAIIVLMIALIVKKDEYRDARNVWYQRAGMIVRFHNPLFRKNRQNRDEEEPLNSDTKSLCEEKY